MEKPKEMTKLLVVAFFITALVVANVIAAKVLNVFGLFVPGAFLLYAVTFLCTDLISEWYGKKEANRIVFIGFIVSVFASIMIMLTGWISPAPFATDVGDAYKVVLGSHWRIVLGSMIAYYAAQSWDVWFFDFLGKITKGKHRWLRNNGSTVTSQLIDTALFITIAFGLKNPHLWEMLGAQYLLKVCIALLDTPIFYYLTRKTRSVFQG